MQDVNIEYHIFKHRLEKGYSLRKLEILSGVAKSEINDIENGKKHPTMPTLYLISKALKTALSNLYTIKD